MTVSRMFSLAKPRKYPFLKPSVAAISSAFQSASCFQNTHHLLSLLLEQHGFSDIKVEDTAKGHIVLLQEAETLIQIEEDSTHIICDNDEMLRVRLRDLVLKFLQKF